MTVFADLVEENKIELQGQRDDRPYPPVMFSADAEERGRMSEEKPDEAFFENRDRDPEIQD